MFRCSFLVIHDGSNDPQDERRGRENHPDMILAQSAKKIIFCDEACWGIKCTEAFNMEG